MKKKIVTVSLIVEVLTLLAIIYYFSSQSQNGNNTDRFVQELLQRRETFQTKCNRPFALIRAYEDKLHFLRIENPSQVNITIKEPDFFYNIKKIETELSLGDLESDRCKIAALCDFVEKKRKHTYPLYESAELHDPVYFFNVYGCGFCDDAAQNLALLAEHFGYESRVHWLEGHVVAGIRHDGEWRIYDADSPFGLGIVKVGGQAASMNDMVRLAKENKLARYNEEYRTAENNRISPVLKRWERPVPDLKMEPCEKRFFYKDIYMLSNDGHYLSKFRSLDEYFGTYRDTVANFVREIPFSCIEAGTKQIVLKDYFPLCGLFVILPKESRKLSDHEYPAVEIDTDIQVPDNAPLPKGSVQSDFIYEGNTYRYIDLSLYLKNLEFRPSHNIRISNLEPLRAVDGAKILTVHYYCIGNSYLTAESLKCLDEKGLHIQLTIQEQ